MVLAHVVAWLATMPHVWTGMDCMSGRYGGLGGVGPCETLLCATAGWHPGHALHFTSPGAVLQ